MRLAASPPGRRSRCPGHPSQRPSSGLRPPSPAGEGSCPAFGHLLPQEKANARASATFSRRRRLMPGLRPPSPAGEGSCPAFGHLLPQEKAHARPSATFSRRRRLMPGLRPPFPVGRRPMGSLPRAKSIGFRVAEFPAPCPAFKISATGLVSSAISRHNHRMRGLSPGRVCVSASHHP